MRIAHVSDCYAPRTGGIETQVRSLAIQQAAAGRHVEIVTATLGHDGVASGRDMVDEIPVHRVAMRLPAEIPVHPLAARRVTGILRDMRPDVVHVHAGVISPFAWPGIRAATSLGIPTLVTVHSVWGGLAHRGFRAADAVTKWSSWGAQLSSVSAMAARRISDTTGTEVLVVPNGIDLASWPPVASGDAADGVLRVVAVMRLAPRKRLGALLRILREVDDRLDGRLRATIAGSGPELGRARKALQRTGLAQRIILPGRMSHAELLSLFGRSDVFVQPSVRESFGLAALEARTSGLPVVVRSQSGSVDFIRDHVEGLVADDDAGMVDAIVRLARDRALLGAIRDHNSTTPPAQAWGTVLATVDDAYSAAARLIAT